MPRGDYIKRHFEHDKFADGRVYIQTDEYVKLVDHLTELIQPEPGKVRGLISEGFTVEEYELSIEPGDYGEEPYLELCTTWARPMTQEERDEYDQKERERNNWALKFRLMQDARKTIEGLLEKHPELRKEYSK